MLVLGTVKHAALVLAFWGCHYGVQAGGTKKALG